MQLSKWSTGKKLKKKEKIFLLCNNWWRQPYCITSLQFLSGHDHHIFSFWLADWSSWLVVDATLDPLTRTGPLSLGIRPWARRWSVCCCLSVVVCAAVWCHVIRRCLPATEASSSVWRSLVSSSGRQSGLQVLEVRRLWRTRQVNVNFYYK